MRHEPIAYSINEECYLYWCKCGRALTSSRWHWLARLRVTLHCLRNNKEFA